MKHYGDITKLNGYELPVVDCITGGSPCQDLSVAGARVGLVGDRSGLFMEQIRIVKEMREHDKASGRADEFIRPRYMVWENVPGAFSSNNGKDFQAVLTEIVRIAEPDAADVPMPEKGRWSKAGCLYDNMGGWSVAWRVHDAQFWGVPQRRKRIALVADFGGMSAPEVLFERKGMHRYSEKSGEKRERDPRAAFIGTDSTGNKVKTYKKSGHARTKDEGQGWEHSDVSDTLNVFDNSETRTPTLVTYENHSQDTRFKPLGEVCQTISHNFGTGGNNQPLVVHTNAGIAIESHPHDSRVRITSEGTNQPLSANMGHDPANGGLVLTADSQNNVRSIVRRLTPLECERLQGFPDGWTAIGEWEDTKGKKHKESDSHRYKALGNSIAIPFWFYLLRRISAQYERPATMGSLFDGIGGFPLCWERCNGKGTALWASEIEEFPIAVTKRHFAEE